MKKANRKQQKIVQELDYKIDEYYKTHDDESDEFISHASTLSQENKRSW